MPKQFPIDGRIQYGLMRSHIAWMVEGARSVAARTAAHLARRLVNRSDPAGRLQPQRRCRGAASLMWAQEHRSRTMPARMCAAKSCLPTACCRWCSAWRWRNLARPASSATCPIRAPPGRARRQRGALGAFGRSLPQGLPSWCHAPRRRFARQMAAGHPVRLGAHVKAEVGAGHWTVVTGIIPGTDASAGEIVYSCHLDHQRPGANDNGSGCVTILESARMLSA